MPPDPGKLPATDQSDDCLQQQHNGHQQNTSSDDEEIRDPAREGYQLLDDVNLEDDSEDDDYPTGSVQEPDGDDSLRVSTIIQRHGLSVISDERPLTEPVWQGNSCQDIVLSDGKFCL